jgi:GDP-L-fucose synthase
MHVDDMAAACIFVLENLDAQKLYDEMGITHINVGVGEDLSIMELALLVKKITGYEGGITLDTSKPNGTPRKIMDNSRLRQLGFVHRIGLEVGIRQVYSHYLQYEK